eukprot:NODE_5312_length_1785_cov_3.387214.p1 GENE.NODE_5312_length_1785_cov_3.387214~~NODE_5312_length_1785_cov_3.387214.p1  ORF type:complete len:380 (-),score=117.77 NODE_5312_length_1785_cov_3.387214:200-1339(-)
MKALEAVGLKPDTDDKFDDSTNESKALNVFFNRILMVEPGMQNALFDTVATLYSYLVCRDQAEGHFDDGPEALDRPAGGLHASVEMAESEVLYKDPETGAETTHLCLRVDRAVSWQAALAGKEGGSSDANNFYWHDTRGGSGGGPNIVLAIERPLAKLAGGRGAAGPGGASSSDDDNDEYRMSFNLHRPEGIGAALGRAPATPSGGLSRNLPLVRARVKGGGAIGGGRVRADQVEAVRYALGVLLEEALKRRAAPPADSDEDAEDVPAIESMDADAADAAPPRSVMALSKRLEEFLRAVPGRGANWEGWAGAHQALLEMGLISNGGDGLLLAQEAMADLQRSGKVDIDAATGAVVVRDKPRGLGWYVPPPKKAKTVRRR